MVDKFVFFDVCSNSSIFKTTSCSFLVKSLCDYVPCICLCSYGTPEIVCSCLRDSHRTPSIFAPRTVPFTSHNKAHTWAP